MTYQLRELDADTPIIEVVLLGSLEDPEVQASLAGAIALQNQTGIPDVLVDASAVSHGLSIPEVLALADVLHETTVMSSTRQAVVRPVNVEAAVSVDLWTVAVSNRGMSAVLFPDRESALEWLTSS